MTTSGAPRVGSGTSSNTWPPAAERTEPLRMHLNKVTIEDLPLRGKRVIIRADFNVPLDESGHITDDTRIRGTLPTINYAVDEGNRKSTRLNSSHLVISYAVFCLKKKKTTACKAGSRAKSRARSAARCGSPRRGWSCSSEAPSPTGTAPVYHRPLESSATHSTWAL